MNSSDDAQIPLTPRPAVDITRTFMRNHAAKHFVWLTYQEWLPNAITAQNDFASCFVLEIDGHWVLVTAGHVINGIKEKIERGSTFCDFVLHDQLAGNEFPLGVPYPFQIDEWAVIDDDDIGSDYAAAELHSIIVMNLDAGGIDPIGETAWTTDRLEDFSFWLLVGMPTETYLTEGNVQSGALHLVPLTPTERPVEAIGASVDKVFAKIKENHGYDLACVENIAGMSGGPIFGAHVVDGVMKYWLIGLQSSWYASSRTLCFCPMIPFLSALKFALQESRAAISAPQTRPVAE